MFTFVKNDKGDIFVLRIKVKIFQALQESSKILFCEMSELEIPPDL